MTKRGYEYNIERLSFFLGEKFPFEDREEKLSDMILFDYTRIMDYCGGPIGGWAILLLEESDYADLLKHIRSMDFEGVVESKTSGFIAEIPAFIQPSFTFPYKGYKYSVRKIDSYPITKITNE
jgi:hypothetical protein